MQPTVMTSTLKPEELVETNAKSLKKKTDALLAVFLCLFAGGSCAPFTRTQLKKWISNENTTLTPRDLVLTTDASGLWESLGFPLQNLIKEAKECPCKGTNYDAWQENLMSFDANISLFTRENKGLDFSDTNDILSKELEYKTQNPDLNTSLIAPKNVHSSQFPLYAGLIVEQLQDKNFNLPVEFNENLKVMGQKELLFQNLAPNLGTFQVAISCVKAHSSQDEKELLFLPRFASLETDLFSKKRNRSVFVYDSWQWQEPPQPNSYKHISYSLQPNEIRGSFTSQSSKPVAISLHSQFYQETSELFFNRLFMTLIQPETRTHTFFSSQTNAEKLFVSKTQQKLTLDDGSHSFTEPTQEEIENKELAQQGLQRDKLVILPFRAYQGPYLPHSLTEPPFLEKNLHFFPPKALLSDFSSKLEPPSIWTWQDQLDLCKRVFMQEQEI